MKSLLVTVLSLILIGSTATAQHKFHGHGSDLAPKTNYDSLFAEATILTESAHGRDVVAYCNERYGGKAFLEGLKTLRLTSIIPQEKSGDTATTVKLMAPGRKFKYSRTGAGYPTTRYLNGTDCWVMWADSVFDAQAYTLKSELFSYLTLHMPLAMETEPFSEIRYGRRTDDPLEYIYLVKTDSMMMIVGIDPADSLIKSADCIIYNDGRSTVYGNKFDDFKTTEGFVFPHAVTSFSLGLEMGTYEVTNVEINPDLPDDVFIPPGRSGKASDN